MAAVDDDVDVGVDGEPGNAGDEAAREGPPEEDFREFVTARWSALLRTAYLLTGEYGRAEDLVQGALIRVHRHWSKLQHTGSPDAYVRRIMVNLNTDWWRRFGSRERAVGLSIAFDRPSGGTDPYATFEMRDELWAALQELPGRMRATLVLRYFEDLTEAETARILGCSVGSVKSQTSRGLDRLADALTHARSKPSISSPVRSTS